MEEFRFDLFNEQKYDKAYEERNRAEAISAVLYPNDDTDAGKRLRLKQQYFFSSASLRDLVKNMRENMAAIFPIFQRSTRSSLTIPIRWYRSRSCCGFHGGKRNVLSAGVPDYPADLRLYQPHGHGGGPGEVAYRSVLQAAPACVPDHPGDRPPILIQVRERYPGNEEKSVRWQSSTTAR